MTDNKNTPAPSRELRAWILMFIVWHALVMIAFGGVLLNIRSSQRTVQRLTLVVAEQNNTIAHQNESIGRINAVLKKYAEMFGNVGSTLHNLNKINAAQDRINKSLIGRFNPPTVHSGPGTIYIPVEPYGAR